VCLFVFSCSSALRALRSFPTRRSSDLQFRCQHAAEIADRYVHHGRRELLGLLAAGEFRTRALRFGLALSENGVALRIRHDENDRSEEHTSELQSRENLVCRLLLEKKKT